MSKVNITGLKDFQKTVNAVVNNADEYNALKRRNHNQRKTLHQQQATINDLKESMAFDDGVIELLSKNVDEAINSIDKLQHHNSVLKESNRRHISKLIRLKHVLNRADESSYQIEFR